MTRFLATSWRPRVSDSPSRPESKYLDRGDAVNLARNWLDKDAGGWGVTTEGVRILADAVMRMDEELKRLYTSSERGISDSDEAKAIIQDAARWRYVRSNVSVEDRQVGYCVRYFRFETNCDKRTIEEAVDFAMHPDREPDERPNEEKS